MTELTNNGCIIVQWTQITDANEFVPDSLGDLYFVPISQITDGMFLQDNFVYATLIIGEKTYEKCLCKVISKENLKVDFRNTYVRPIIENDKIVIKYFDNDNTITVSDDSEICNKSNEESSSPILSKKRKITDVFMLENEEENSNEKCTSVAMKNTYSLEDTQNESDNDEIEETIAKPSKKSRLNVITSDNDEENSNEKRTSALTKNKYSSEETQNESDNVEIEKTIAKPSKKIRLKVPTSEDEDLDESSSKNNYENKRNEEPSFPFEKIDKTNINASIYEGISSGLKMHIANFNQTSNTLTNTLQTSKSVLENGIRENNQIKKSLFEQQQRLNPIQKEFVQTLVEIKNYVIQQTSVLSNMSANLFQLNERVLSYEKKLDDIKILFKNYKPSSRLFEEDLENSQVNEQINSRRIPVVVREQNSTVPSVSPTNVSNQIINADYFKGLSENNRFLVGLLVSNGVDDVKKLYDTKRNLYDKIRSEFLAKIEDKKSIDNLWLKGVKAFNNFKSRRENDFKNIVNKK